MSSKLSARSVVLALTLIIAGSVATPARQRERRPTPRERLMERIRKQLVTLPYYGVFDNLAFKLQRDTVILYGQVLRPTTRKDAEERVSKIEGVERVINNIEVLPLSPSDEDIRRRTYRAVFGGTLSRYALGANPSIHIVVNRGRVTLEGVVSNSMDRQLAYMSANGVPGVFSVTNHLRVEKEG